MSEPTKKKIVCPSCNGEGWDMYDGHGNRDCQVCSGRGEVDEDNPEVVSAFQKIKAGLEEAIAYAQSENKIGYLPTQRTGRDMYILTPEDRAERDRMSAKVRIQED